MMFNGSITGILVAIISILQKKTRLRKAAFPGVAVLCPCHHTLRVESHAVAPVLRVIVARQRASNTIFLKEWIGMKLWCYEVIYWSSSTCSYATKHKNFVLRKLLSHFYPSAKRLLQRPAAGLSIPFLCIALSLSCRVLQEDEKIEGVPKMGTPKSFSKTIVFGVPRFRNLSINHFAKLRCLTLQRWFWVPSEIHDYSTASFNHT